MYRCNFCLGVRHESSSYRIVRCSARRSSVRLVFHQAGGCPGKLPMGSRPDRKRIRRRRLLGFGDQLGLEWLQPGVVGRQQRRDRVWKPCAAGTITIGNQVAPNSITFNPAASGNYVIAGGSINLPNAATSITVNTNATISSVLVGSGGLSKSVPARSRSPAPTATPAPRRSPPARSSSTPPI